MSLDDPHSPKHIGSSTTPEPAAPVPVNASAPPAPPAAPSLPPQIEDFDALINGDVRSFVDLGEKIGGLVAEQVSSPSSSFLHVSAYLTSSTVQGCSSSFRSRAHLSLRLDKG